MLEKLNKYNFETKSNIKHKNKYDYSLVEYIDFITKVKIICPIHGVFEQSPKNHLRTNGCSECYDENKKNTKKYIIKKSNEIFITKYDYSLVDDIIDVKTKLKIMCPIHGIFEKRYDAHLSGQGCLLCKDDELTFFITKSNKKHNNKYDYSLVIYINNKTKVKIICPIHGIFEQRPDNHLHNGCPYCSNNLKSSKDKFEEKSNIIYNYRFDYSLVVYVNNSTKVDIICKYHGIFKQSPNSHLSGHNCPHCNNIKKRLRNIEEISKRKFDGLQIIPNFNRNACEMFEEISLKEGIHIQHAMNGGEYHIKELGYWVDGYDKENNVVYEFDEKHHFKNGKLKEKDIIRQKEIENYLKCKFIRIKE